MRHKEDILRPVLIEVLRIRPFILPLATRQPFKYLLKRIADILEEDQPQDDVLVLRGIDIFAELVGGASELGFEGFFVD